MSVVLTNVTGGPQTGFTSPVWVVTPDNAPNATTGKMWNVGSATGTVTGTRFHSISDPFTVCFERPSVLKTFTFAMLNAMTGLLGQVPFNVYTVCRVRKGVNVAVSNPPRVAEWDGRARIPAGADSYDAPNVRAGMSLFAGAVWQQSSGIGDMLVTGTL